MVLEEETGKVSRGINTVLGELTVCGERKDLNRQHVPVRGKYKL